MRVLFSYTPVSAGIFHLAFSWGLIFAILLFAPPVFSGDTETARNYLNTIAATLSTILALCISIVLVAIQLSASKYSHRVLDFFIRLPFNASLLSFYLLTIFHSIYVLSKVQDYAHEALPFWLDQAMSADLFLLICCFLSLLVYMYAVMKLLKPETIIRAIVKEYVAAYRRGHYREAVNRMEQIADIAKRGLADLDGSTAMVCVEYLAEMMGETRMPSAESDQVLWYHRKIVHLLLSIASIAFKERETSISSAILDVLFSFGQRYAASGSLKAAGMLLEGYEWIMANNVLGERQHSLLARVIEQTFHMTCEIVRREEGEEQLHRFVLHSFHTLRRMGQQILQSGLFGHELVAKQIISKMFGSLLETVIERNGPSYPAALIRQLLYEYMKLARLMLQKAEMGNLVYIISWLREEMRPHREQRERLHPYLFLFAMLGAISLYLQRWDMASLLLQEIGKDIPADSDILVGLLQEREALRPFFDYQEAVRYVAEWYVLWRECHRHASARPKQERPPLVDLTAVAPPGREVWQPWLDGCAESQLFPP